jgi:hypothetical protein
MAARARLSQSLQMLRSWLTGPSEVAPPNNPEVMVHDPAAKRAHDLDDPFFDDKVQARMADVIAGAGHKK